METKDTDKRNLDMGSIEKYNPEELELEEIITLNRKAFRGVQQGGLFGMERYEKKMEKRDEVFVLKVYLGEELVADSIAYVREGDSEYNIWVMAVSPEQQGKGIGSRIFDMNEEKAKEMGSSKVTFKAHSYLTEVLRLAFKRGYVPIDRGERKHKDSTAIYFSKKI